MTSREIKRTFIDFFKSRDHLEIPNSSLVPEHDPTLLFVNSGMAPLKNYFLGIERPPFDRLVNVQRCIRTEDLKKVGPSSNTLTFFEMMGSWSVGGYGRNEAIHFAFDLLTEGFGLDPQKLYATVFEGDDDIPKDQESIDAWVHAGLPHERIVLLPACDNLWSSGPVGPIGPCTEVLYDRGEGFSRHTDSRPGKDSERFWEIWNAGVFMEYNRLGEGSVESLPIKSVDTGAGLERFAAVLQDKKSVYETDQFLPIVSSIEQLTSAHLGQDESKDVSIRVIADHARAITFALADGVVPSNTERGYVVRRLIRRAVQHGRLLGLSGYFLETLSERVIGLMSEEYPHLRENDTAINEVIRDEEEKFGRVLAKGEKLLKKKLVGGETIIPGKLAFKLFDTYGLPLLATKAIAHDLGLCVDEEGFTQELEKQQERSRRAGEFKKKAMSALGPEVAKNHTAAHLLNEALRRAVDPTIHQAGQDLTAERVRFDFNFHRALTSEELKAVEDEVKEQIEADVPVVSIETTFEEAAAQGVQALFADKYKSLDKVTMYKIGDYSKELCGGPHVSHTGEIKSFKILKQESVGRGVRRLRAVAK